MKVPNEILIIFFLISFLVYTMPSVLVNFNKSFRGKLLLLLLTIVMTIYNKTAGILIAMFVIFLTEFNYEFNNGIVYEGLSSMNDENKKAYGIIGDNGILSGGDKKKKMDQLAIEQALKPTDGNVEVIAAGAKANADNNVKA